MLAGYEVLQAKNGKQGVELAIKYIPDIILCDIMMPELDGYGVLYLLSKREETSLIPLSLLLLKADRAEIRRGIEMGADDYLTKPFDDIELLNAIEGRLKKKEHQKKFYSSNSEQMDHLFQPVNGLDELKNLLMIAKSKSLKRNRLYNNGR